MIRSAVRSFFHSTRGRWIAAVCLLSLVAAWPFPQTPRLWPDSAGYLAWSPERLPVFTLVASVLGASYLLVCVHFVLSLSAWSWFGYTIGGVIGLALGAAFAIALPVYVWHLVVLSESVSLTLLAAVLAATISLSRRWGRGWFRAWVVLMLLFVMTRTINVLLLPFLVVPFLSGGRRRLLAAAAAVAAVTACGVLYGQTLGAPLRETSLTNIYMRRIAMEEEWRNRFMSRGMPLGAEERKFVNETGSENKYALFEASPAFERWLRERGTAEYVRWVAGRWQSYRVAWNQLFKHVNDDNRWVSAGTRMRSAPRWLERFYVHLYVPFWLWLPLLFLPAIGWRVCGRVGPVAILVPALMAAVYVQAFAGYHGDATEESRHMINAFILYKLTIALAAAETVRIAVFLSRRRGRALRN